MLFFIEEPEINLHPGYQRLLIDTLMKFKNFQFFITTHSNHLLDISLDYENISVFTFQKQETENKEKPEFKITNVKNDDPDILDLIEVRNASVFLSNCTIWVEGITDRLYIRKYLEVYQEKLLEEKELQWFKEIYKEDLHYSFVEYSGVNLDHWEFDTENISDKPIAQRLSRKIFLIADKDSTEEAKASKKKNRYRKIIEILGDDKVSILKSKEIENLLQPEVILNTVREYERNSDLKYEEKTFTLNKYKNEYLGDFIHKNIQDLKRKGGYKADSGTLKDKVNFAHKAINYIEKFDDLSKEARELTEKIFKFIESNNPK